MELSNEKCIDIVLCLDIMNGWDIEVHVIHRSVRPELQPFDSFAATMFSKEAIGSFFAIFGDVEDGYVRTSEK